MTQTLFTWAGARRFWNGRDGRGHYLDRYTVTEDYPSTPMCPHKCCQGKRAHPAGEPIQRWDDAPAYVPRKSTTPKADHPERRKHEEGWSAQSQHAYIAAESATNGYLIRKDRAAEFKRKHGHRDLGDFLYNAPAPTAYRYASPELLEHWRGHGRSSAAEYAEAHGATDARTLTNAGKAKRARDTAENRAGEDYRSDDRRAAAAADRRRKRGPLTEGDKLTRAQNRHRKAA